MSRYDKTGWIVATPLIFLGIVFISLGAWKWYAAGVQKRVYDRQGIQMTQWEVFVGAEPAEKNVKIVPSVEKP